MEYLFCTFGDGIIDFLYLGGVDRALIKIPCNVRHIGYAAISKQITIILTIVV